MKISNLTLLVLAGGLYFSTTSCSGSSHATESADSIKTNTTSTEKTENVPVEISQVPPLASPNTIPAFTFYNLKSGISFTQNDLAKKGNIVFILFDPGCSHCQHEAAVLSKNYDKLKSVNFYLVTMNDPAMVAGFMSTYAKQLDEKPNVTLLYDRNTEFVNKFNPTQFPATYVYGTDKNLKTYWDGEKEEAEIIASILK